MGLSVWIVVAVICAFLSYFLAKGKGRDPVPMFLCGLFLGPIGVIIAAVAPANPASRQQPGPPIDFEQFLDRQTKKCPRCAEWVKFQAKVCRFCQNEFDQGEIEKQIEEWKKQNSRTQEHNSEPQLPR